MDHMNGYFEADKGRFDCVLVRRCDKTVIAYTNHDRVETPISGTVDNADRKAVVAFAEQYELPIRWGC